MLGDEDEERQQQQQYEEVRFPPVHFRYEAAQSCSQGQVVMPSADPNQASELLASALACELSRQAPFAS